MKRMSAVAIAALLGLAACGRSRNPSAPGAGERGRKILFYRSPMNPEQTSPVPAKDSMGMDYVPVYADERPTAGEPGSFHVDEGRLQLIGVKTETARRRDLVRTIRTVARVAYDPELYRTQEEYLAARAAAREARAGSLPQSGARARSLLESSRLRLRLQGLSDKQIDDLGETGKPDAGLLLPQGKGGLVWLYAEVFESDLPLVRVGERVRATTSSLPGEVFKGVIVSIDPVLNPKTRSARARIQAADPRGLLRPDMYLDASLRVDMGERLSIPRDAVVDTGARQVVFIDRGNGVLVAREVRLGARADDWVEVREGLSEGDRVVTSGNFLIDSESKLQDATPGTGTDRGGMNMKDMPGMKAMK